MTPIFGHEPAVVPFVAGIAGLRPDFGNCRTLAVVNGKGELVAGVVFHNWNPEAGVIELTAASLDRRWATRGVMNAVFDYVFSFCQAAVARTAEDNRAVRKLWQAFGASEYIIPRLRGRAASEAVIMLTDDAWAKSRYQRTGQVQHGKKFCSYPARSETDFGGADRHQHRHGDCQQHDGHDGSGDALRQPDL